MSKYRKAGSGTGIGLQLPSTLAEVEAKYNLVFPGSQSKKEAGGFSKPTDVPGIQAAVVNALITSSLCSASDKTSWAHQLYKIYQQYPDSLLRNVMAKLRDHKMVSLKKHYNKVKVKEGNYLPLSSAPYQLSVTFAHTFVCRYQYDIYHQAWQQVRTLLANPHEQTEIVIGQEGGFAAAVVEMMAEEKLHFRVEVPEQLVVLDPSMQSKDENYVRILQRYQELLRNAGAGDGEEFPTTTTLFSKAREEDEDDDQDDLEESFMRENGGQVEDSLLTTNRLSQQKGEKEKTGSGKGKEVV